MFTNSKHQEHSSGCLMLEDFVTPAMQKGGIRTKPTQNADVSEMSDNENDAERGTSEEPDIELFHCPEVSCSKKYSTYRGIENHLLCEENFEKKVKAAPMGWDLKKPRKSSRFPRKVRTFLTKKYESGDKERKANPSEEEQKK
uniref:Uncharacterized protein n=1 Tax=Magallana gigas TaxID=29159 RepID=A0A8W8IJZ0_MAGGI